MLLQYRWIRVSLRPLGLAGAMACSSCDGSAGDSASPGSRRDAAPPPSTVEARPVEPGQYSYALTEATADLALFTAPATAKLRMGDRAPTEQASGLHLSAARGEFEPVQLALGPASGSVTVTIEPFEDLGSGARTELFWAEYVDGRVELLQPVTAEPRALRDSSATVIWISVYVPRDASAGEHVTSLSVQPEGRDGITVPITLTVFDFELPEQLHFATQLNINLSALSEAQGSVDAAKGLLFDHRMTPKGVTWPSGFGWNITWENSAAPEPCAAFYDESAESDEYAIRTLGPRYILGDGWNDVGFPNAMLFQFVDNSTPRPATFCGNERGDPYGSSAYNDAWSEWLSALDAYLTRHGLADRAYYYVLNEPQNAGDEALAAHLCRLTKAAAPNLRLAISEEPKPSIAEDAAGTCGYDIWIAHVRSYARDYAWTRQRDFGEQIWFYSLDQDPDPYFNPTSSDRSGIHQRIIPWVAWTERIRGWAYYDAGRFFSDGRPTVRAELLREGFEDYEYLWLANAAAYPSVESTTPVDATVRSVAASMTSFTKDVDALQSLRHELGRYIEGSRSELPLLEVASARPVGAYFINFQDPAGDPSSEPLVANGNTFIKVGWAAYDAERGYGWSGEHIADPGIALYGYDDVEGYSELEKSYVYDDYGRDNLFEFALAAGTYSVSVGVGRPARGYPSDPHQVAIEGTTIIDDTPTTDEAPALSRTVDVNVTDGSLSVVVGGRSPSTGDYAYTFLAYLIIEPAAPSGT